MGERLRQGVAPAYLLLCLMVGGSAQGIWTNMLLQLAGLALIAWAAASPRVEPVGPPALHLVWIGLAMLAIVAVQLVPLPGSVWPHLGGRGTLAEDYRLLGLALPARPLALMPHDALSTLFRAIPATALFLAIVRLHAYRPSWLALALAVGTLVGILLGVLQVASADPIASQWYLYPQASWGQAVGFFANANQMGDLLVITLPFLAAVLASVRGARPQQFSAIAVVVAGIALVILVGIALNRSVAAYVLILPVLAASVLIAIPLRGFVRGWTAPVSIAILGLAAAAVALGPIGDRALGSSVSVQSRARIAANSVQALEDFLPLGSGLGSFPGVYRLYEDHDRVDRVATNHAHNDYLELAVETGVPGILVMLAFLVWWVAAARRVWTSPDYGPYARAAVVASAAILFHSLVEFPLRTAALSGVFAMCLALMSVRVSPRSPDKSELWPTRHVQI